MWWISALVLAAAPVGTTVTPFRTEVAPRVDPVFEGVAGLRQGVDRFLALDAEMEQVRAEFSMAVNQTLAQLAPATGKLRGCPPGAVSQYTRALGAGSRYLLLGRQLEARYREIQRSEDLGEGAGLTPDYRVKMKNGRDKYLALLRDYREMRVAFYDQLGAEMRFAGCALPSAARATATKGDGSEAPTLPDPTDPAAWALDDPESPTADTREPLPATRLPKTASGSLSGAAPAIWINVDNSRCAERSQLTIDGVGLGAVAGHKKMAIRTRSGPHEVCVLPSSDKRACGDSGTLRRAYLYEGWTLVVRCQ